MGDGRKLFVAKLPQDIEEDEMDQIFSTYGKVEEVVILDSSRSNRPDERCGFVIYKTPEAARIAVQVLNKVYRFREESVDPIHVSFARTKEGKGEGKGDDKGDRKGDRKGGKGKDKNHQSYNESYHNDRNDRHHHDREFHGGSGGGRGYEAPPSSPYSASRPVYRGDGGQTRERSHGARGTSDVPRYGREDFRGSDFGRERELERDRYPPREQTRPDRGYRDRERERNDHYDRREANYPPGDRLDRQRPDRDRQDRQDRGYDRRPERYDDRGGYDVHSGHDRGYRTEGAHRPAPGYSGHSGHSGDDRRGAGGGPASGSKVYVGNLPSDISKDVLQQVFTTYGAVEDIHIMTGRSKSGQASAFIKYFGAGEASDAIAAMARGYEIRPGEGPIVVRLADGEGQKGGGRGGDRSRPY